MRLYRSLCIEWCTMREQMTTIAKFVTRSRVTTTAEIGGAALFSVSLGAWHGWPVGGIAAGVLLMVGGYLGGDV